MSVMRLIAVEVIEHQFKDSVEFLDHIAYMLQICRDVHAFIIFNIGQIAEFAIFNIGLVAFRRRVDLLLLPKDSIEWINFEDFFGLLCVVLFKFF